MYEYAILDDENVRESLREYCRPILESERPCYSDHEAWEKIRQGYALAKEAVIVAIKDKFIDPRGITAFVRTEFRVDGRAHTWIPDKKKCEYFQFPTIGLCHIWNSVGSITGKTSWLNKIGVRIEYNGFGGMSKHGNIVSHTVRTDKSFLAPLQDEFLYFVYQLQSDLEYLMLGEIKFPPSDKFQEWLSCQPQ